MRRLRNKLTALLLALTALLCACTGKPATQDPAQRALDFRQALLENGCSFEAEITADFEDYVCSFTLSCEDSPDGGIRMRILAPETLAGITAQIEGEQAKLVFDDTEAAFGTLSGLGISPMAAPAYLGQAWRSGYMQFSGIEDGTLHVTYLCGYGDDEIRVDTWFSDGAPVRAELSCDGHTTVQIDVTDFKLRKAETNNESTQKNMG